MTLPSTMGAMRRIVPLVAAVALGLIAGCGGSTTTAPAGTMGSAETATAGVRVVQPADAKAIIDAGATVIDVRTPGEFAQAHVAGAQNISVEADDFADRVAALDRVGRYVVYCRTGRRSALAAEQMRQEGFVDVADAGGLDDLVAAGVATE